MTELHSNPARVPRRLLARRAMVLCCAALLFAGSCWVPAAGAQATPETIGRLTGDDVEVTGAVRFDVENGRSTAILASGSEVTVRSGQARIVLAGGGEIAVCGPAHFSLLKSGDAITLALDYGRVHPLLDGAAQLTVYTPLVVATPIAIGQGSRDITVGLDQAGAMCTFAASGALRIEQQFSGQSLLVPQGGAMNMADGQISAQGGGEGDCGCDLLVSRSISPKQFELSVPASPPVSHPTPIPPPQLSEQPVYMVYMPPLTFDSSAPAPPPAPDPQTILLLREARVQPEVVFHGRVEPAAERTVAVSSRAPASPLPADAGSGPKSPGLFTKFFNLFRRHKRAPCAGSGCDQAAR